MDLTQLSILAVVVISIYCVPYAIGWLRGIHEERTHPSTVHEDMNCEG